MNHMTETKNEGLSAFSSALEKQTGNDYDTYISLCPEMDIISEAHVSGTSDDGTSKLDYSVKAFIQLLGFKKNNDLSDMESVAMHNRLLATLYSFSLTDSQQWSIFIDNESSKICCLTDTGTLAISVKVGDGEPPFVISSSYDFPSDAERRKIGDLSFGNFSDVDFKEVRRGVDLGEFSDLLFPEMFKWMEQQKEAEVHNTLETDKTSGFSPC